MNTIKVKNIAELKTRKGTSESIVEVLGYYTEGDGGGGIFYWDNTSTTTDNTGTVIQVTGVGTGRWIRNIETDYYFEWFGIKGNGTDDDTLLFRNAVSAIPEYSTLKGNSNKIYVLNYQSDSKCLEITKSITLDFNNSKVKFKPYSNTNPEINHSPAIWIHGSKATGNNINNVINRANTITLTVTEDSNNYNVGDWIEINTNATKDAWNKPDGLYNTFGYASEIQKIQAVNYSTGVITLSKGLDNLYPTQASINKITLLKSPCIKNISNALETDSNILSTKVLTGECGHFISVEYTDTALIENIEVENFRLFAIYSGQNINIIVDRIKAIKTDNKKYVSSGGHVYLIRHYSCTGSVTKNCTSFNVRHLLDYTQSYDCFSQNNIAFGGGTAFLIHGFGERRITSENDSAYDSEYGWSYNNVSFDAGYEGKIKNFSYSGTGRAISVGTNSSNVLIENPTINIQGNNSAGIWINSGANDITVRNGLIDCSKSTVSTFNSIRVGVEAGGYSGVQISSASATAGVNSTVTLNTSSAHGFLSGQSIYLNLSDTALGEYSGTYTVNAVNSATQFTFVRTGTTTQNLSITSSPFRTVHKAGNFKPVSNITIDGVKMISNSSQSAVMQINTHENWKVINCTLVSNNNSITGILANNIETSEQPKSIEIKNNIFEGTYGNVIQIETVPTIKLNVDGNTAKNYSGLFLNLIAPLIDSTIFYNTLYIINNSVDTANVSCLGICNHNLWTVVSKGGYVNNNKYPLNSVVTSTLNKNYEYGVFTPEIFGASTAGTATYTNQTGLYYLTNNTLNIRIRLNFSSFNGVGQMRIKTLPVSNSGLVIPFNVGELNGLTVIGLFLPIWTGNYISLRQNNAGTIEDVPVDSSFDITLQGSFYLTNSL